MLLNNSLISLSFKLKLSVNNLFLRQEIYVKNLGLNFDQFFRFVVNISKRF